SEKQPIFSPRAHGVRKRSRWASVPKARIGSQYSELFTVRITACEPHCLASSMIARMRLTASAPLPPQRSGIVIPIIPSSPSRFTVSCGKRSSRSSSSATGLISLSANSRAIVWIICCSSLNVSRIVIRPYSSLSSLLLEQPLELGGQRRHDLEEVGDDPVVGDLEDRRLRVLVDGHDDLGRAHAGEVLNGAGNAKAQVELGRDGPSGLADLETMRTPAGIHGGARGADGGADDLAHVLEDHVVLRALHSAATRDDDLGLGQLGKARRDFFATLDELHLRAGDLHRGPLDGSGLAPLTLRRA